MPLTHTRILGNFLMILISLAFFLLHVLVDLRQILYSFLCNVQLVLAYLFGCRFYSRLRSDEYGSEKSSLHTKGRKSIIF